MHNIVNLFNKTPCEALNKKPAEKNCPLEDFTKCPVKRGNKIFIISQFISIWKRIKQKHDF